MEGCSRAERGTFKRVVSGLRGGLRMSGSRMEGCFSDEGGVSQMEGSRMKGCSRAEGVISRMEGCFRAEGGLRMSSSRIEGCFSDGRSSMM